MLQVAEAIVLVLEVVIDVCDVGQRRSIQLLHRDACLHHGPLVIEEELQLILVLRIVFCDAECKAQTRLISIPAVAFLADVIVDSLFRLKSLEAEEAYPIEQVVKVEISSFVLVDRITQERYDLDVDALAEIKELFLKLLAQIDFFFVPLLFSIFIFLVLFLIIIIIIVV